MKLTYDARHIAEPFTGLGRYSGSLLEALIRTHNDPAFQLTVLLQNRRDWSNNPFFSVIESAAHDDRCELTFLNSRPISLAQHLQVSTWLNQQRPDHYFYPHFDAPLLTKIPTTFVVHDLIPLKIEGYIQSMAMLKRQYFKQVIRLNLLRKRTCFTASRTTLDDMTKMYPDSNRGRLHHCYLGVAPQVIQKTHPAPIIDGPYILYVGDRRPHKNIRYTIDIFREMVRHGDYKGQLALVGTRTNHDFDVDAYVEGDPHIRVLGNVDDATLEGLYRHTDALMLLSSYEGFGLPVIEAAKWDRKVVVSDGGSLPEIAPIGSCVVPLALDVAQAARIITAYLISDTHPDGCAVTQSYSWENAARTIFPFAYHPTSLQD